MSIHVLGIRHHGPGSAKNVKAFLERIKPDIILVEGPPEANDIVGIVTHKEMKPPVAILAYVPEKPDYAAFYPFAEFSPEWQALCYASSSNIPVRFFDLPLVHKFALEDKEKEVPGEAQGLNSDESHVQDITVQEIKMRDPIGSLAEAAGYCDGEVWWEQMFEHRSNNEQVFEAVSEAMQAARELLPSKDEKVEMLREAYMRKMIRQAEKEMFRDIVVICGAWHAPALINMPSQKDDNELLKNLPKVKVETTWVPWTYNRLTYASGYGAGIPSPGWYEHTWKNKKNIEIKWMSKVARLFRKKQVDVSVAHVIEAVRLAESLAALRGYSHAGLEELNEAALSVLCNGESILLQLIREELIVSDKIGHVPAEVPKPPLLIDIEKAQKKLRLPPEASAKAHMLDLREERDLEKSILLHRLTLLDIRWGRPMRASGKGTFKEQWHLQWQPEFSISLIEKGAWGNTIEEASANYVIHLASGTQELKDISDLLQAALPAELPRAIDMLVGRINNLAAASGDVMQLMHVLPSLVNVSRYGNVRKTDVELVLGIVNSMVTRICIGLPAACVNMDEDAAQQMIGLFTGLDEAIVLLQQQAQMQQWNDTLTKIAGNQGTAPVICGYSTRLLADHKVLQDEELVAAFARGLSAAADPVAAAGWIEGFLKGSGTMLLIDQKLWSLVNNWVMQLNEETFRQLLPIMRRTFSQFTSAERRKIGEQVRTGGAATIEARLGSGQFNEQRALDALPVVLKMLGINEA